MTEADKIIPPKSVTARALSVLSVFSIDSPSLNLTEICDRTGLALATGYRLVQDLNRANLLDKDEATGTYSLGSKLWEMGMLSALHGRLRESAMPFLLNLQYNSTETVQLATRELTEGMYIEKLSLELSSPVESRIGARIPLHATGIGKALLAWSPAGFLEAFLSQPLKRYSDTTITDPYALQKELQKIRRKGYSNSYQEYHLGSHSIAAPVLVDGEAIAAVGLVRYDLSNELEQHRQLVMDMAEQLGQRLTQSKGIAFPSLTGIKER